MSLKSIVKKILRGDRATSQTYSDHLRRIGIKIGVDTIFYSPKDIYIDEQYPWLITIGSHVRICDGVMLLTHDYSWSVLKLADGESGFDSGRIMGASGPITIGDNVFIGVKSTILRDVTIGNNVIIGANSLVTKDCLPNAVYAGSPARRIMSLKDFYDRRDARQLKEARRLAQKYFTQYHTVPPVEVFHEYFQLFSSVEETLKNPVFRNKIQLGNNADQSIRYQKTHSRPYATYEEFINSCDLDLISHY